jgi:hypothetical protein
MISSYHFFLNWQDKPQFNERRAIAMSLCGNIAAAKLRNSIAYCSYAVFQNDNPRRRLSVTRIA